jgi:hypothetical protein
VRWILPCGTLFYTIQSDHVRIELREASTRLKNDNITREEFFYDAIF